MLIPTIIATLFNYTISFVLIFITFIVALIFFAKSKVLSRKEEQNDASKANPKKIRLAFFHPKWFPYFFFEWVFWLFSNAGGGGEKVLWCMVQALMKEYSQNNLEIAIYTGKIILFLSEN